MNTKKKMRIMFIIEVIVVIAMLIIGIAETSQTINKLTSYKHNVVYEFTNKNITWD